MLFPVATYGCESGTIRKAEHWRIDAFKLWCWRKLSKVLWTARRSNQSILKEIILDYSLEGLMLKLKFQYFGHLMRRVDHWKRSWCWERLKAGREGGNRGWDGWQSTALMNSFPDLEPIFCFMSSSNSCFFTCLQIPQEAGQVVWYSHLL